MNAPKPRLTAKDICERLRVKYPKDQYAMMFEVRNGTGYQRPDRYADALAMSLWPSRGLDLMGFEIKVSRSDWKNELAQPEKADAFIKYCDRWYLVVGDPAIVHPGELPPTWGLIVPYGTGLKVAVEAPKLPGAPLDRLLFASLMRNVQRATLDDPIVKDEIKSQVERQRIHAEHRRKDAERERDSLKKAIEAFEAASGVRINEWGAGRIGEAVKFVAGGGLSDARERMERLLVNTQDIETRIREALASEALAVSE